MSSHLASLQCCSFSSPWVVLGTTRSGTRNFSKYLNQILELDPTGAVIETYGTAGSLTGQFNHPTHLMFVVAGSNEELYVMDTDNDRAQVFSVTGS